MDDFLYILIGIAWIAYSFYSNKQKQDRKKAAREMQADPAPHTTTQAPTVKSILEEILMGELKPADKPEVYAEKMPEPEYIPAPEAVSSETVTTEAASLEYITEEVPSDYFETEYKGRREEKRMASRPDPEPEPDTDESVSEIAMEFNLKTAVIYAEILNPRHF